MNGRGLLSGKYTRTSAQSKDGRSAFMGHLLNEQTFALGDELEKIAKAHDSTVARRARVAADAARCHIHHHRCTSPAQLEDNVKSLEVKLTTEELAHLDEKTKPRLGFPANMQPMFPGIHHGGATVNGVHAEPSPFVVLRGEKPC